MERLHTPKLPLVAAVLVWAFVAFAALPHPASANISGAIYTTNADSSMVNENLYANKDDVYLSGGPRPPSCSSPGLDDGTYYFQVTDPNGSTLLSTDPLDCRVVTVTNGVVTAYGPAAAGCTAHLAGVPIADCGETPPKITVQLSPYNDTPNAGGVYKLWMTPIGDVAAGCDPTTTGAGCFVNSSSKTDNFRVANQNTPPSLQSELDIFKFCDVNGNGVLDPDELLFGLSGWTMNVTGTPTPACSGGMTGLDGRLVCSSIDPGTYGVSEVLQSGYTHTATCTGGACGTCAVSIGAPCNFDADCPMFMTNSADTCNLFGSETPFPITLTAGAISEVDIGNVGGITGRKFSDLNGNGIDDGEPGVQGVQFLLTGTALDGVTPISLCTNTDANGNYSFPLTPGDNLLVTEVQPPNSIATTPLTCNGSFGDPANPSTCAGFNCEFGNACLGGSCAAKTLGYWANHGNSSITGADLCALTALNLVDGRGNSFDPISVANCAAGPTYKQITNGRSALSSWLLGGKATNMAYMLSVQFATMTLNTLHPSPGCSLAGVSIYVGTPPTTSPKCLSGLVTPTGFITLANLMTDTNNELGKYPVTTAGKTDRTCQGFKETSLDNANNSESTTGPGVIDVQCPAVTNPCPPTN
jgi:hypothetical protein